MIGPDSSEDMYNGFIETAEKYGLENYKIVYSEEIIPYAYVIPGSIDGVYDWGAWQAAPMADLPYICPETYDYLEQNNQVGVYSYTFWRPYEPSGEEDEFKCYFDCGKQHYEVYNNDPLCFVLASYWQLIPTDENGNDILKLASDSMVLKNSLKIS